MHHRPAPADPRVRACTALRILIANRKMALGILG